LRARIATFAEKGKHAGRNKISEDQLLISLTSKTRERLQVQGIMKPRGSNPLNLSKLIIYIYIFFFLG